MKRLIAAAAVLLVLVAGAAIGAEPIEGRWLTPKGAVIDIAACPQGFCLVVVSGERAGLAIGHVAGGSGHYEGELVNPDSGKVNAAKIDVGDEGLTLSGCAGIICAERTWTRE